MGSYEAAKEFYGGKAKASPPATVEQAAQAMRLAMAGYDSARPSDEFKYYWANADAFDADSAHSKDIRHTLIRHSRYEQTNNGYADGIAQTYSTDIIGVGPSLRMQTSNKTFNRIVDNQWYYWCQATNFRQKLWTKAHAKHVDGESFGVLRRNPRVKHPIDLDVVLYEAEQCSTPYPPIDERGYIDGIKFDEFNNPLWYDFLREHPGSSTLTTTRDEAERVPADRVLHWYKVRRPGQHRGVPETSSTLNLGAAFRRLREATLSTAEKSAAWTLFLKTAFPPEVVATIQPMQLLDINRGMMTTLPAGVEPSQLQAEQPGPNYTEFHRSLLNEQARPKNMPFNKAACDSASYNYASGRLDHQTYYAALDVDREDCNDMVLEPLFTAWFEMACVRFGWFGGNARAAGPSARAHVWDWPKHRVADVQTEADANRIKLETGQIFLPQLYAEQGQDFDDAIEEAAKKLRTTPEEICKRLLDVTFPPPKQEVAVNESAKPGDDVSAGHPINRLLNGKANGVHLEN